MDFNAKEVKQKEFHIGKTSDGPVGTSDLRECVWLYVYSNDSKQFLAVHVDTSITQKEIKAELKKAFNFNEMNHKEISVIIVGGSFNILINKDKIEEPLQEHNHNKINSALQQFSDETGIIVKIEKFSAETKLTPEAVVVYGNGNVKRARPAKFEENLKQRAFNLALSLLQGNPEEVIALEKHPGFSLFQYDPEQFLASGEYKSRNNADCYQKVLPIAEEMDQKLMYNSTSYIIYRIERYQKKYAKEPQVMEALENLNHKLPIFVNNVDLKIKNSPHISPRKIIHEMLKQEIFGDNKNIDELEELTYRMSKLQINDDFSSNPNSEVDKEVMENVSLEKQAGCKGKRQIVNNIEIDFL